jgi:hypothetical protein
MAGGQASGGGLLRLRQGSGEIVRDQMKFLNDDDKSWMMSKTIERVWPFA